MVRTPYSQARWRFQSPGPLPSLSLVAIRQGRRLGNIFTDPGTDLTGLDKYV